MSDVLGMRFSEVELVGQDRQTPPGGFVSDLVHHISQSVDVPADVLQHKPTQRPLTCGGTVGGHGPCVGGSLGLHQRQLQPLQPLQPP